MSGNESELETKHKLEIRDLGNDIHNAVKNNVKSASSCIPIICNEEFDTHLLFTYCHGICNDNIKENMILNLMLVDAFSATHIKLNLSYEESEIISVKNVLKKNEFTGICFAWSEKENSVNGFCIENNRLAPIFYAYYHNNKNNTIDCVHSSASKSNYYREIEFTTIFEDSKFSAIVCPPIDAY